MKRTLIGLLLFFALTPFLWPTKPASRPRPEPDRSREVLHAAAVDYMFQTYRDPATNTIPRGMHRRVLKHVRTLAVRPAGKAASGYTWAEVGPSEYGGRTRALLPDIDNPDILLAGGVSGGMWRSTDQGTTWTFTSTPGDMLSVTALAQDVRAGQRNVWYAGTGEFRQSAADLGQRAPDFGTGLHKSIDGGQSWFLLPATFLGNETVWDSVFDYCVRLSVSPTTGTLFVASNGFGVSRSVDGGSSFALTLGGLGEHLWCDVAVSSTGAVLAVISEANAGFTPSFAPGVYRSLDDGATWQNITPATFPSVHRRSVLAIAPSDPDVAYIMTDTGVDRPDGRDDVRLHRMDIGAGTGDDRTANLPNFPGTIPLTGPSVHTQNDFDMVIVVKPDDPDFVVYGGTTIYRTADGFATPPPAEVEATRIGGYGSFEQGGLYLGVHHPDNHTAAFHPARPGELLSGNDGGVYISRDVTASEVTWEDKNETYNVTQFYTTTLDDEAGDPKLMGGTQDNFQMYLLDERSTSGGFGPSTLLVFGDGGYGYFGNQFAFGSRQFGEVFRLNYLDPERLVIEPVGQLVQQGGLFIHPFAIDPNDEGIMYTPWNQTVWRNTGMLLPDPNPFWQQLPGASAPAGYAVTALAVSRQPAHVLYIGATSFGGVPLVYRLDNSNAGTLAVDVSVPGSSAGAYVHAIEVNPDDAQEVMVVYSNYNVVGLYHSLNGGTSWDAVEGDLTGDAGNPGPSLRWVSILPTVDGTLYFVATSAGVFSTDLLSGASTQWTLESPDMIGNTVTNYVCSRPSDGRVLVGTHGRGMFVGDPMPVVAATSLPEPTTLFQNAPNPFNASTTVRYWLAAPGPVTIRIFDVRGREVLAEHQAFAAAGMHEFRWHGQDGRGRSVASGTYALEMQGGGKRDGIRMSLVK